METTNLKFYRVDISPYQSSNFTNLEIEKLSGLSISPASNQTEADILITNTHTNFKALAENLGSKVKLIIHPNSGYDNIPASFVRDKNFPIITGNPIRANGVTEYILSCVFKHFCYADNRKTWDASRSWPRTRLADQNVLIIGRGLIGDKLYQSLSPLVNSISSFDPFKNFKELDPKNKDIILLAASLNKTSAGLIDTSFLSSLPRGALLVNAARGKIINQSDLKKHLKDSPSFNAYLDVFETEPFEDNEFSDLNNLHCTSHIAGVSKNLDELILEFEYKVLSDFITHRSNIDDFLNTYSPLVLKNKLSTDKSFLI